MTGEDSTTWHGTSGVTKGSRALGPFRHATLVLRWFRERDCVHYLTRDDGISQATGHRYLHQGIDVLAETSPPEPHAAGSRA